MGKDSQGSKQNSESRHTRIQVSASPTRGGVSRAGIRCGRQPCCVDPPLWNRDSTRGGEETRVSVTDHRKE